jgi:hypothetical protein
MKIKFLIIVFGLVILFGCSQKQEVKVVPQPEAAKQTTPPGPKTIFFDNFDGRKNEWQQVRGNWKVGTDGFFLQRSADPRHVNSIIFVDHPQAADCTIETFVRIKPDLPATLTNSVQDQNLLRNVRYIIGAGIIFRYKNQNNFYMFRLAGEEGAVLGKMVDGVWVDLSNPRSADYLQDRIKFSESNWYRLKVDAYGDRIVCYINDSVVVSKADTTFSLGNFGLCTFKTKAHFDYMKVYDKTEIESTH